MSKGLSSLKPNVYTAQGDLVASPLAPSGPVEALSTQEHEALCNRCGKCCYKKIIVGRMVLITPFPCEFLDTHTNACTVYENRHEKNPHCLNMAEGFKHRAFPADCTYLPSQAPPGYRPAVDTWSWKGEWDEFDELAELLEVSPRVREEIRARGPLARPMWEEAFERLQNAHPAEQAPSLVALAKERRGSA